jgi:phospholipase C
MPRSATRAGIHRIRHVVIIMQENRSFDNYFGTFPHADGIRGLSDHPGRVPCIPDPKRHRCVARSMTATTLTTAVRIALPMRTLTSMAER